MAWTLAQHAGWGSREERRERWAFTELDGGQGDSVGEKKRKEHSWLVYTSRVTQGNPAPMAFQLPPAAITQLRGSGCDSGAQGLVLELLLALSF